jgi:hypothetical protein
MGRGLSDLQRFVVTEAGKRRRLYYADVLHHFFGFAPKPSRWGGRVGLEYHKQSGGWDRYGPEWEPSSWEAGGELAHPGNQRFDPEEIGRNRYRSALASVSRACLRLSARGLVTCLRGSVSHWSGVEITDKGRELLSVNSGVISPRVNR